METTTVQYNHLFFVNPLFYFWVFSFALMLSAIGVVMMRNIVHCALSLCLSFICTAGIFVILGAEFLAAAEVLIYAGGVTILILFAIMLSQRIIGRDIIHRNRQSIWAMLVSIVMALVLIGIYATGDWSYKPTTEANLIDNVRVIGRALMITYTLVFWVASIMLTIAMIGALYLAKRD
jgi:NADH-quinone oxidoreductase subunit J